MDWIKIRSDIDDCDEVMRISLAMEISQAEAVGLCVTFWAWADRNTDDGNLPHCTTAVVDRVTRKDGFAAVMVSVGWLVQNGDGMLIPNFDRHMSECAKKRILHARSQEKYRNKRR